MAAFVRNKLMMMMIECRVYSMQATFTAHKPSQDGVKTLLSLAQVFKVKIWIVAIAPLTCVRPAALYNLRSGS